MIQAVYENLLRLKQTERILAIHKYLVLLGLALALGVLPYLSYVYQVLPTNAALCLGILGGFALYSLFYYTRMVQQHRAIRYEICFLEFHQDTEQYKDILKEEDHLWTDSNTFAYLKAQSLQNRSDLADEEVANSLFLTHFAPLFPNWLNLSPAFIASLGWLIWVFPGRLNPSLAAVTQNLYFVALGLLATAFLFELITTLMRYQAYQKAIHLEQWMNELATTVLTPLSVEKHPYPLARVAVPTENQPEAPVPVSKSNIIPLATPPHPDAPTLNELLGTLQQSEQQSLPKLERKPILQALKFTPNPAPILPDFAPLLDGENKEISAPAQSDLQEENADLAIIENKVPEKEHLAPVESVVLPTPEPIALPISADLSDAIHLKTIGRSRKKPETVLSVPTVEATPLLPENPTPQEVVQTFVAKKIILPDGTEAFVMEANTQANHSHLNPEKEISRLGKLKRRRAQREEKREGNPLPQFQSLGKLI